MNKTRSLLALAGALLLGSIAALGLPGCGANQSASAPGAAVPATENARASAATRHARSVIPADASGAPHELTARLGDVPLIGELASGGAVTRKPATGSGRGDAAPVAGPRRTELRASVNPDDELWVIARRPVDAADAASGASDDAPGSGALVCASPTSRPAGPDEQREPVPLPLEHTSVTGGITGYIASVEVRQRFHNPFDEKIEAVYVFPLPQNAAVSEFVMVIGERRIRGIIREREEAERIYREAQSQGYTASLLTQERPNIFTQRVANIEPGRRIDVEITYYNTLTYTDGWFEFVFPMVVGPRFNPPGTTDGIGATPRGARGGSGQATEIQYLRPEERSGHDIALDLTVDAGVPVEEIDCATHVVDRVGLSSSQTRITLSPRDAIPNRDFVLRYRVAGDAPKASMLTHRDTRGGFFTLMVYPPRSIRDAERAPLEMVFVLDCSGSMSGEPIAKARRAVGRALVRLKPEDTFQVIRFSNDSSALGPAPIPATRANVRRGVRYVESLQSGGGTHMLHGIRAALDFPHDPERLRYVVFLTDGYIGNEVNVLGAMHDRMGDARVFSFGVGSAPNRYLMNRMAKMGRGVVAYVGLNDDPTEVVDLFVERISHPAMTDVAIDWGDLDVRGVQPARLPDLFAGRPILLTGRFDGTGPAAVTVRGRVGGETVEIPVSVDLDDASGSRAAIAGVWARSRIAALMDRATFDRDVDVLGEVRGIALEYGLLSAYTAFVAVGSSRRTEGEHGTTVPVAVPVPDGVRYETTVSGG